MRIPASPASSTECNSPHCAQTNTRTTDEGCGQELVFPSLGIKKALPLNQPIAIDVTMPASGKLAFTCGMDMMRGTIVAD